jgi:hypothetical protein
MNKALLPENANKTPSYTPSPMVIKVYCSAHPTGSKIYTATHVNTVKFVVFLQNIQPDPRMKEN